MAPQAATLPTPALAHSHARKSAAVKQRGVPTEERVSVLEAQWETLTPALATKADIGDLRSEILKWGVGAAIALFTAFAAMFIANTARIDRLDGKIDASVSKLDAKLESSVGKLDAKLESSVGKLDAKIDALAARQDARMDRLDAKLDALMAELVRQRRSAE